MRENDPSAISLHRISEMNIEQALELCRDAGWNQLHQDWQRLIRYEPNGCFVATLNGQPVGTVTTTRYGRQLGWIGMMLVHPGFRRRGIANALIQRSIAYLNEHHVQCVKLDATPTGYLVYEKLGFQAEWSYQRWSRTGSTTAAPLELPATSVELPDAAVELDRQAFGADRGRFLERLSAGSYVYATRHGFGMLRPGYLASYLGPVSAETSSAAESIIGELCRRTDGPVFWDVPGPNSDAAQIAKAFGFEPVRDLTRMWLGDNRCCRPDLQLQYALSGPATG